MTAVCMLVQLLTMNIMTKLLALLLLGAPFVAGGGLLYKLASGSTWQEALFKSYAVLQNVPGQSKFQFPSFRGKLLLRVLCIAAEHARFLVLAFLICLCHHTSHSC